jgi:hypothetical protein
MLWAPTRSRCPWKVQWGQQNRRPLGLATRRRQEGSWRRCHAHPPAAPRSRPAQPCRARLGAGGCGATPATGGSAPARRPGGDALEVAHDQGPTWWWTAKAPHLLGRLMLGLMDAAAMARLGPTHPSPMPDPRCPGLGPGVRAWPAWTSDHRDAGSCRRGVPAPTPATPRSRSRWRRGG